MDKQKFIDSIFMDDNQECVINTNGKESKIICDCENNHFYRLVSDYIVCTKCFTGYSCDRNTSYIKVYK